MPLKAWSLLAPSVKPGGRFLLSGRKYTGQQKADVLTSVALTSNVAGSAKQHDVPVSTARRWVAEPDKHTTPTEREESKNSLLSELDKARWKYLTRLMDDAVVNKESGYYASQSFKILNEQHQLLSGGPTQRFSLADYLRGAAIEGEFKEVPATTGGPSGNSSAP